jgi:hypothetical protein
MDFQVLKNKALELKKIASEKAKQAVSYSSSKLTESTMMIRDITVLTGFIHLSQNISWTNPQWGEQKVFIKQSLALFVDTTSEFQKKMLVLFPVLFAKAFSQNIAFKMVDSMTPGLELGSYQVLSLPSLVVFENEQVKKVITGEEYIEKVVKSLSLDIHTTIETLS